MDRSNLQRAAELETHLVLVEKLMLMLERPQNYLRRDGEQQPIRLSWWSVEVQLDTVDAKAMLGPYIDTLRRRLADLGVQLKP